MERAQAGFFVWARRIGTADHTQATHRTWARLFDAYLADQGIDDLADVTPTTIADFQAHVLVKPSRYGRPYAAGSRSGIHSFLKKFFGYLVEHELLLTDPTRHLRQPRTPRRLPRGILTVAQMRRLIGTPNTRDLWGLRDRAILELLYGIGLRYAELANLELGHVDLEERTLWVRQGKGRRDRVLPLGRWAAHWVRRYLNASESLRRRQGTERVFLTPRGRRLANGVLNEKLRTYAKQAGIRQAVTLHALRHAFATHLLKGGADVRHIQRLLGHLRLSSTAIYTHLDVDDLRQVQLRCHPRERVRGRKR